MQFQLKVHKPGQGVALIDAVAGSADEAARSATEQGWHVVSVARATRPSRHARLGQGFPLVVFAEELLSLMSAGLPLVECIEALGEKAGQRETRPILQDLALSLRAGRSLSQAMAQHSDVFPALLRASIEASERTGSVPQALERYIEYARRFKVLQDRLQSALVYPLLLAALGLAVVLFLLAYVVPRFSVVFADRVDELPALSAAVVRAGIWLAQVPASGLALLLGVLVLCAGWAWQRASWDGVARLAGHVPWVHARVRLYHLSRMYRSLGMLVRGGMPVPTAMALVAGHVGRLPGAAMDLAIERVREGLPLSMALQQAHLTTQVALRLVSAGERSGRVGEMLEAAADFTDQDLGRTLDWTVRLAEPVLMALIGLIVGGIVVLMYLPIFQLADSIQ